MPGNPTFTSFADNSNGTATGVKISGTSISTVDGGEERFEFNENFTGKKLADIVGVIGKPAVEAVVAGENVNVLALNGQELLYQYNNAAEGLVHVLVSQLFEAKLGVTDAKTRVLLSMVDIKRNKISDLLSTEAKDTALSINSKDGERVPSFEGAALLAVNSAKDAHEIVAAALSRRAKSLAQAGLNQVVHTILQVHFAKVSESSQKNSVLSFVNVNVSTDESSLQFAAMARDYGAGNKKLKNADNLLLQSIRTSLGGIAHTYAYASLQPGQGDAVNELTVKTLGALAKVKDTASSKDFKPDEDLADDAKWAKRVANSAVAAKALWPTGAAEAVQQRDKMPHLIALHTDHLVNGRNLILLQSGSKRAGRDDSKVQQDIVLNGLGIHAEHCVFSNLSGKLSVKPSEGADVLVNGKASAAGKPQPLEHNDRVRLGTFLTFRVVVPGKIGPRDSSFTIEMAEHEVRDAVKASSASGLSDGSLDPAQQEKIGKLLPMVNEANNIAEELKRSVNFMLKMVACQTKGETASDVQVQVTYNGSDETLWDAETFLDRVYEMRDIYDQFVSRGRDLMYVNSTFTGTADPLAKQSGENVVGRAMIYLDAVSHLLAVHETTPIIDYKGFSRGELKIELDIALPNVPEKKAAAKFDELERIDRLKGKQLRVKLKVVGIRGLPSNMCENACVSFRFFLDESPLTTPKMVKKTINPKFNFEHAWNLVVTDELCSYLASDVLEFTVWAKSSGTADTHIGGASKEAAGPSGVNEIDEEAMHQLQEKEEELQELRLQLSEQKVEMERKLRESKGGPGGALEMKTEGKAESVAELKEHIEFLEQKIETLENEKKQLQVQLVEREEEMQELQNQVDDDEETMQQQLTKIQELEQELADAKKSKACVIL